MENEQSMESRVGEPTMGRRRLLKAAVATAPVIATLSSGAALAGSSNLIGATSGSGTDALGRTLCFKGTPVDGLIDLGAPPHGQLTAIRERYYREGPTGSAAPITERAMCARGGDFYYQDSGWRSVNVPQGIVVSAMALSSFTGSIYIREV
jgi:hypothetical protein